MNLFIRTYCTLLLLAVSGSFAFAQNLSVNGRFPSRHFSIDDYGSAAQIWTGMQGTDNFVYFGNNDHIISYNGIEWRHIEPDTKVVDKKTQNLIRETEVTSLFTASNDVMYVGREDNFGYIAYDKTGVQCYYPLLAVSGTSKESFGSIWNIYELNNQEVVFVGERALYTVKDKTVKRMTLPAGFEGLQSKTSTRFGNGLLIVFQGKKSQKEVLKKYLFIDLLTNKPRELKVPEHVTLRNIRGSFEVNGTWYVLDITGSFFSARQQNNDFIWNSEKEELFPELSGQTPNFIYRHGDRIYMGTETQGVIIADLQGKIVRRIDLYDGLEDLNVYNLFHDKENNLWLCLDNGIQLIETSSPLTYFRKDEGVTSLAEAIDFASGKLLLGLHSDVFAREQHNTHVKFASQESLNQFIFDIETFETSQGKKTLVIGYNGLYEYFPETRKFAPLPPVYGLVFQQDSENKDVIYLSLESGISQLALQPNGQWQYKELVTADQLNGNTFSLESWKGKIYFGIYGQGIGVYNTKTGKFSVIRDKELQKGEKKLYYVEQFRGEIYVGCANKLFTISGDDKKLIPFARNADFFSHKNNNNVHRLVNINDQQLWVVLYEKSNEGRFETGWLELRGKEWVWTKWPLEALKRAGIVSTIQQGPDNEVWLGASNGLFVLNFDAIRKIHHRLTVSVDRFEVNGKVLSYNIFKADPLDALTYSQNSFKVIFHANSFIGLGNMQYRYKLEGFDDRWSEWSDLNYASFQKIGEGNYTLKIQARNTYGIESEVLSYNLQVLPPWYRSIWAYMLYVITLVIIVFVVVQLSTKRVKRQNQRLEAIVKERTSEIAEQNNQLEQQKAEITAKTTDILDSIQYAKRIQTTILPSQVRLNELFEHFVFYRPKDIVSGDFYWAREVQGKTIFSAIDCTGHGVPGSLVSIVGNNGLLRAVNEFKLTEPNEILDKLREIVVEAFRSEGQADVKDGMDIALCSIEHETATLKFSGANNECVIIRNGEVIELKPDKQPIGSFVDAKPFSVSTFQLQDGDAIYLYTDGYVDQFGGEKGKKFKSRQFKTMLSNISDLPLVEQFNHVQYAFDSWKSDLDQVDDVCVFGVRYRKR